MSRVGVIVGNELQIFDADHWALIADTEFPDAETIEVSDDVGTMRWDPQTQSFTMSPIVLLGYQVVNLFTPEEVLAILNYEHPTIPEATKMVRVLWGALALNPMSPIEVAGTYHQQGVELLFGLELLTEERAEEVAMGVPAGTLHPLIEPED